MDPGWILAIIAAATTVCTLAGFLMRWVWHTVTRTGRFLDDYFGEPPREGMPARPGVMARLMALEVTSQSTQAVAAAVLAQTRPDGGESMRDELRRIGGDVTALKGQITEIGNRVDRNTTAIGKLEAGDTSA